MATQNNTNKEALELKTVVQEKAPLGYEKFSVTLKRGKISKETLHALIEFQQISKPYNMLKVVSNMLFVFMENEGNMQLMEDDEKDGLDNFFRLMYTLWAAEHKHPHEFDLDFF